ncbi:xanthine dehydrogenase family protein subunit M [Ammoniphilus sp. CFH 90114]|uniref:FAD binding domain-containing protein n=1 Tax=Ammoniphilus sp. CFH 90114 TaxID=2493665 RepID=UPI00100E56A8|nr:xanthine dehydrogenase family protein subunit M [Ammoniphilus sp. CFH 90114]RXT05764.1 xanthine dehydrogenase family protein subunit M [Ammoniphilus sp. CFH 90114]
MRISEMELISPKSVLECLSYLQDTDRDIRLIAGGTDTVVQMKEGKGRPKTWVNIKGIKELRFIREEDDGIHIGPLTTHTDLIKSRIIQYQAQALADAAWEVGATQIRNMGTLGGNLATASPAGDTIPALYVLDAVVELQSIAGKRKVPIEDFFYGPRKTAINRNEMITNIIIQPQKTDEVSIFQKLGPRRAQAISIVNVAIRLRMGKEKRECIGGKIAFGSVAPTVIRAHKCESLLRVSPLTEEMITNIGKVAWKEVAPISDIRASAEYRRDMAGAILERGLYRLMKRWENR